MTNKVDAQKIKNAIGETDQEVLLTLGEGENVVEITVQTSLSVGAHTHLVNSIADMVIYADEDEEVYAPSLRQFALGFNLLNYFTNIELPDTTEEARRLIECTDIVDRVLEVLPNGYFKMIVKEADALIEYRKAQALKLTKLDRVLDAVLDVIKTAKEQTNNFDMKHIMEFVDKYAPQELKDQLIKAIVEHTTEKDVE